MRMRNALHSTMQLIVILSIAVSCGCSRDDAELEWVSEPGKYSYTHVGYRKDGKKHGRWAAHRFGVIEFVTYWKDGVEHGPRLEWWDDGAFSGDAYYINGKQEGRSRFFSEHGQLTDLRWWVRGKPHGYWCEWDDDGKLIEVARYHLGTQLFSEEPPQRPCPYTASPMGRHHFDPNDRTYETPYPRSGKWHRRVLP